MNEAIRNLVKMLAELAVRDELARVTCARVRARTLDNGTVQPVPADEVKARELLK